MWFQSTFPHGERQRSNLDAFLLSCFNPRSRTGNDRYICTFSYGKKVSIHVPARGTTKDSDCIEHSKTGFNPRSRTGNDRSDLRGGGGEQDGFNPRSRTGNDEKCGQTWTRTKQFQSTFPHGERHHAKSECISTITVSIHVPARGTTSTRHYLLPNISFQSTFPHGERRGIR